MRRHNAEVRRYWLPFLDAGRWISFTECIERELDPAHADGLVPDCVRRGLYADQLDRYFDIFFSSQIMLIRYSEFVEDTCRVLQRLADFLQLHHFDWECVDYEQKNKGSYKSKLMPAHRTLLETYFEASNQRVFDRTGWERF